MKPISKSTLFQGFVLLMYVLCVVATWLFVRANHLSVRDLAMLVRQAVYDAGWLGPVAISVFYLVQTIIPFPTIGLAIVSGAVYGPFWGSVIALFGLNLSGAVSFWAGRYFGRHFISEIERGWIKKYDDMLHGRGFFTTLFMRLFMFPFDFTSLGCGMTQMSFRQYLFGTFLGVIPGAITFVVLGESFHNPRAWILFGSLGLFTLVTAVIFRYSKWGKLIFSPKVDASVDMMLK